MKAKTIKAASMSQLAAEIDQSRADGFRPSLALVFLSVKQDCEAVSRLFDQQQIALFGATTAGEFIDGQIEEGSIVAMLLELAPRFFKILLLPIGNGDLHALARQVGEQAKNAYANPAFLLSYSGLYTDGEMIVKGIEEVVGEAAVIFGGMAGDDLTWAGPCVFTNSQTSDKAILAMIIDGDKILLKGHASGGWKPVGTVRTITKSEGSMVYTIDGEPALAVVMKFLGLDPNHPDELNEVLVKMGSYFPILLQRGDDAPVARTSMFANVNDGCLKFSGNVPQGAKFRFSLPPDFEVVNDVIAESKNIKKTQLPQADALVMFSCVSRHVTLGPLISEEIEGVKDVWGSPLIGFFSYGEIGKAGNGRHELYNNTCCLVALKEKNTAPN